MVVPFSRLSFRQALLASFLLIAAILGAAAVSGLFALEDFAVRSRTAARNTLGFSTAIQQLGERTVDMERSARQFLVLGDPVLLDRFRDARNESLAALTQLSRVDGDTARSLTATWRESADAALAALEARGSGEPTLRALSQLVELNRELAHEVRIDAERNNRELLAELERNQARLAWQILAAMGAASALAAVTGWWVVRPLNRVERTIEALGESCFDRPVDVSGPADLRQLGRRLDWLRVRLRDLEANRARVLRHVSHELKTPLASLREGVALLGDGVAGQLSSSQQEVVGILDHNARVLQERIEGLLGYNTAVFDAGRLRRQPTALRPLLESLVAEQQLTIQAKALDVAIAGAQLTVVVDPAKLRIAVANLLSNAISFSPHGGKLRLEVSTAPHRVYIDCTDEGPGVAAEEAERIFDPFFQGSRQPIVPRHGSGLGLSIVREFIIAHGGRIRLLPSERGAHFRIELPYAV